MKKEIPTIRTTKNKTSSHTANHTNSNKPSYIVIWNFKSLIDFYTTRPYLPKISKISSCMHVYYGTYVFPLTIPTIPTISTIPTIPTMKPNSTPKKIDESNSPLAPRGHSPLPVLEYQQWPPQSHLGPTSTPCNAWRDVF